jgi:hypothetical protein
MMPASHSREQLQEYYDSDEWAAKRSLYESSGPGHGRCVTCGVERGLYVHHLVYRKRLGEESLDDLRHICRPCHGAVHALSREFSISPLFATQLVGETIHMAHQDGVSAADVTRVIVCRPRMILEIFDLPLKPNGKIDMRRVGRRGV